MGTFVELEKVYGVDQITRHNMFTSAEINGEPADGFSSGAAIQAIQETAREKLPKGFGIDWAGITRDQILAGNQAVVILLRILGLLRSMRGTCSRGTGRPAAASASWNTR